MVRRPPPYSAVGDQWRRLGKVSGQCDGAPTSAKQRSRSMTKTGGGERTVRWCADLRQTVQSVDQRRTDTTVSRAVRMAVLLMYPGMAAPADPRVGSTATRRSSADAVSPSAFTHRPYSKPANVTSGSSTIRFKSSLTEKDIAVWQGSGDQSN